MYSLLLIALPTNYNCSYSRIDAVINNMLNSQAVLPNRMVVLNINEKYSGCLGEES